MVSVSITIVRGAIDCGTIYHFVPNYIRGFVCVCDTFRWKLSFFRMSSGALCAPSRRAGTGCPCFRSCLPRCRLRSPMPSCCHRHHRRYFEPELSARRNVRMHTSHFGCQREVYRLFSAPSPGALDLFPWRWRECRHTRRYGVLSIILKPPYSTRYWSCLGLAEIAPPTTTTDASIRMD